MLTIREIERRVRAHGATLGAVLPPHTVILCEVGSTAHGVSAGDDDLDLMGACIEGPGTTVGLCRFEQTIWRSATVRTGVTNAPSTPGDVDLVVYSLRKLCRLALSGNPSVLMVLHHGAPALLTGTGDDLRRLAPAFASRRVVRAFLGYTEQQLARLEGRGRRGRPRADLVAAHGFDTKYAGHVWRLAHQGLAYARTGAYPIPVGEPFAAQIRRLRAGEVARQEAIARCHSLYAELEAAYHENPAGLPEQPDRTAVERFLIRAHRDAWEAAGWTGG